MQDEMECVVPCVVLGRWTNVIVEQRQQPLNRSVRQSLRTGFRISITITRMHNQHAATHCTIIPRQIHFPNYQKPPRPVFLKDSRRAHQYRNRYLNYHPFSLPTRCCFFSDTCLVFHNFSRACISVKKIPVLTCYFTQMVISFKQGTSNAYSFFLERGIFFQILS